MFRVGFRVRKLEIKNGIGVCRKEAKTLRVLELHRLLSDRESNPDLKGENLVS